MWVSLTDPKNTDPEDEFATLRVPHFQEGGTQTMGGSTEASLNITYNYSEHFLKALHPEGIRWLDGKTGEETKLNLIVAVARLGAKRDQDYWAKTPGNAGHALSILYGWTMEHPDGIWQVH